MQNIENTSVRKEDGISKCNSRFAFRITIGRFFLVSNFLLLFACTMLNGQFSDMDYASIDSFAVSVPDTFSSWQSAAHSLVEKYHEDDAKVRVLYYWIVNHIVYDDRLAESLRQYAYMDDPDYVYRNRKTICSGYSTLFAAMCAEAGQECYAVPGYIRGQYCTDSLYILPEHMWNVVRVAEKWCHIDLTFDAWILQHGVDTISYLLSAEQLLKDRLPANPLWQFRERPLTLPEFDPACKNADQSRIHSLSWLDTLALYRSLDPVDRSLLENRLAWLYNPGNAYYYGKALAEKAQSLEYAEFEGMYGWVELNEQARECYYEALLCLKEYIPLRIRDGSVVFYKSKRIIKLRKKINKILIEVENGKQILQIIIE